MNNVLALFVGTFFTVANDRKNGEKVLALKTVHLMVTLLVLAFFLSPIPILGNLLLFVLFSAVLVLSFLWVSGRRFCLPLDTVERLSQSS